MKLRDILTEVGVLVPTDISTDILISWVNQVQNNLYRDYPLPEKTYTFTVQSGVQLYNLPADCPEDRIQKLTISGIEVPYYPLNTDVSISPIDNFWTTLAGQLFLSPIPLKMDNGSLYYRSSPKQLTTSDMDNQPDFPNDFQELLVLGVAVKAAMASPAFINNVAMLQTQFNVLKERADLLLTKKRQKGVMIVKPFI